MIKSDEASLAALNALIAVCVDGQQGYETAASAANDPELARFFGELAAQRMKFADELTARVRTMRSEPNQRGTLVGAAHRTWIDTMAAGAQAQAHSLLAECERGEDVGLKVYRTALQTDDVDDITRQLVQRQYEAVQLAHDRVRQLRDSPTYSSR